MKALFEIVAVAGMTAIVASAGYVLGVESSGKGSPPPGLGVERVKHETPRAMQASSPAPKREPVERARAERVKELEDELAAAWSRMANLERLAFDNSPRDAMAVSLGLTAEEVDRWVMRSHLVDNVDDLRLALATVGAGEFYEMMQQEMEWLLTHDAKLKALDQWAFRSWVVDSAREFCEELQRRGLPFTLTEKFRSIVAE